MSTQPFRVGDGAWIGEDFCVIREVDFNGRRVNLEYLGGANDGEQEWWPMSNFSSHPS